MPTIDLAALEQAASAAKAAYAANPTPTLRAAKNAAQSALREARWSARGGEGTYAEHLEEQRAARRQAPPVPAGATRETSYDADGSPTRTVIEYPREG